jgi:hypothetical protein
MRIDPVLVLSAIVVTLGATVPSYRRTVVPPVVATLGAAIPPSRRAVAPPEITVYHSPTCGCCKEWINHLKSSGFAVKSIEQEDLSEIKAEMGVTGKLASCHTAVVTGYVIEGHVPAGDIHRLLKERPKISGLTAPGMPGASPGMDTGKDPYDVLTFDGRGKTTVWARH